ncbi:MAG: hypothetical protein R3C44_24585 [Chloroflexota bacterium]
MSTQDTFSADEWAAIIGAPMLAGSFIAISDPGITSLVGETSAMMKAITSGEVPAGASDLVNSIIASFKEMAESKEKLEMPDITDEKDPAAAKAALLADVKKAVDSVAAKGSADEAAGYKQWIMSVANATAEAAKEGGFMGIGGTRVSDQEKAALAELGATMGV